MKFLPTTLLSLCLLLPGITFANEKLVILLDASNSMWGQIDGQHKISIARNKLTRLLADAPSQYDIGLMTYGNRRKSDCQDINTIAKPGSLTNDKLLQQALAIMPKGRSPLGEALRQAAKQSNNILLISDGNESCDTDPCAISKQLKASNPGLHINILAFKTTPSPTLECIAQNTNGNLLSASENLTWQQMADTPAKTDAIHTEAKPVTSNEPGTLELSAGASNRPGNLSSSFLIYDDDEHHIVSYVAQTEITHQLPPGTYRIDVLWGELKKSHTITIPAGQTVNYHFDFGPMGQIKLRAKGENGQNADANFTFYTHDDHYFANQLLKHEVNQILPIGNYRVTASFDGQTLETQLNVKADTPSEHIFQFK